jgi:hypothetical protein
VEDIHSEGGGVVFDRDWVVDWLESVREREEELCSLREVLDLGGQVWREAVPSTGKLCREAVCKQIMYEGGSFWAKEMNGEERAEFNVAT